MSYREENGQVILTMNREDYERLLLLLGQASGESVRQSGRSFFALDQILGLLDRLNEGNPSYTPYQATDTDCLRAALAIENEERTRCGLKSVSYDQLSPEECSRVNARAQELKAAPDLSSRWRL
jgi:hypothetical protein